MEEKQMLRKLVHMKIKQEKQRKEHDAAIISTTQSLPLWKEARTIALTLPLDLEVDTWPLVYLAWKEGKSVFVPKVTKQGLTFHEIHSLDDLSPGVMGILEPITGAANQYIDLCIVPGRVFNREGYRIGWGGGYYDRFLATYSGHKISLAYSVQVLENIPIESHDIPVNMIVTEKELIQCSL